MADHKASEVNIPFDMVKPEIGFRDELRLPDEHARLVREAQAKATRAKLQLADLEIDYHNNKSELLRTISEASSLCQRIIHDIAQAAGITKIGGMWDFDMQTMTYKRRT